MNRCLGIGGILLLLLLPLLGKTQERKGLEQQIEMIFQPLKTGERRLLVEDCLSTWNSSFFKEEEKDSIKAVFQEMQQLHLPLSDLRNFAVCTNIFCRKGEKENWQVWFDGVKNRLATREKRRSLVKEYLEKSSKIVEEQVLYAGGAHRWLVRGKYTWRAGTEVQVKIEEAEVVCKTRKDSIAISSTEVVYTMGKEELNGSGGMVRWEAEDTITAELNHYRIKLELSEYEADSVFFHYEKKYERPLQGHLKDNASKYEGSKNALYPRFTSYSLEVPIDSLFPGVSFRGGIVYNGLKLGGYGTESCPACIHICPNDTTHLYLYSKRFSIDSTMVMSGMARMELPLDSGLFSHPNINFSYREKERLVKIKRLTEQSLHTPFRDNFHQILFDVEQIEWPVDSSYMEMSMMSRSGLFKAKVESLNYFSEKVYDKMQELDDVHPLNSLYKAAGELAAATFSLQEYAGIVKRPVDQLRKQIVVLSYDDFVEYDEKMDEVSLKPRLYDYVMARVGKKDYDNIRFDSHPRDKHPNARLDLRNFSLKIYGVEKFTISEKKDIYVEPSDKCVLMLKNRDMEFNGKLKAGMFDMYGNKLFFSYDKYTIDLTHVDSAGMYLADKMTRKRGEKVNSLIRDVQGNIVVDKPNNKSGKNNNEGYPVFNSTKDSYVYFDDPEICGGVYKRDSFYFVIDPYTLRDINDASKFKYSFKGTLVSHIVPEIQDTLLLMQDHSLGMTYTTPSAGLPLYEVGNLKSRISMTQQGFVADGKVNLNGSDFRSPEVLLMPDSMLASTEALVVKEVNGRRPGAQGEEVTIRYLKKGNTLQATTTLKPFRIYEDRVKHTGTLFVYQDLLDAAGQLEMKDARLASRLFKLEATHILSQSTELQLSSLANKAIQLNTSDVKADIDLAQNKGKFINNADKNKADFPSNHYQCSFKSFTWYMDKAYLNIGIEEEKELRRIWGMENDLLIPEQARNVFLSTDRSCDSLRFIAPLAKYDLATGDISCHWVNHIDLANGRFYPDAGDIFIDPSGNIREFKAGRFLCERTDKSKMLEKVDLLLKGRYSFDGSGDFDYVNQDNQHTILRFTEIKTDTSRQIYAKMKMAPEACFLLNSGLTYKGDIYLYSRQPYLFFNGYTGLMADSTYLKHDWLKVKTYLIPSDIRIPVKIENRNDRNQRIFNGIFLHVDRTVRPYGAFYSKRIFYNDELLIGGEGEMIWKTQEKKYVIQDTGRSVYYNMCYMPQEHTMTAFGKLDMGLRLPGIYQNASGAVRYNFMEDSLLLEHILYMLDFELPGKAEAVLLKDMADKKQKSMTVSPALIAKMSGLYERGLMPSVRKQLAKTVNNVPDSLNRLFVLDSLSFSWDRQNKSYVARGNGILRIVKGKPVEKEWEIKMELVKKRSGNQIFMYIYDGNLWYYFEYTDRSLFTLSSNAEYNDVLRNEKPEKKIIRDQNKQTLYTVTLCPDSKKDRFLKRMEE